MCVQGLLYFEGATEAEAHSYLEQVSPLAHGPRFTTKEKVATKLLARIRDNPFLLTGCDKARHRRAQEHDILHQRHVLHGATEERRHALKRNLRSI